MVIQVLQGGYFGRTRGPTSVHEIVKESFRPCDCHLGDNSMQFMPALRKQLSDAVAEKHAHCCLDFQT